jgi:signal transduction histidine kinase
VALVGCLGRAPSGSLAEVALFGGIVGMLAWRTARSQALVESYRDRRDQLSAASQRLRELNADLAHRAELEVRLATADERSRIAREIHDNAGHLLVRAVLQAEALAAADPALAGRLAPLAATLDTAMDTIRQSVHDLAAEALDLEAHLASLGDGTGLRVTVDYQAGPLPPEVTRAFIAIAREAVANTLRHSDARTTRIAVADRPGFHQLTMHDDGSTASAASPRVPPGPAPGPARAGAHAGTGPSADAGRGLGLAAIEDRARALGGVSRVSWDRGFRVFVSVPRRAGGQAAADPERTRATA